MLLDIGFVDDKTRPTVPKLEGLTPSQRVAGEHLKEVHDHLRDNMTSIRSLMARAADGMASQQDVVAETAALTLVSNFRRFGNLCGQHCQIVNTHHSIEDAHLFPALASQSEGYRLVTERLEAEHRVVHELLVRQIDALNALARDPGAETFAEAREIYDALERVLLSHLGYEEDQIGDAIGYFGLF
ncbi:MAG: hemerythrin domain-containing protein [Devosia sp.]